MALSQPKPGSEQPVPNTLVSLAEQLLSETLQLTRLLNQEGISEPASSSLHAGANPGAEVFWSTHIGPIETARQTISGLTKQLTKLLDGPRGFLHEYVSSNWDQGALYGLLELGILEKLPLDGQVHVSELAAKSNIPEDKLLCILRLNACEGILTEVSEGVFGHTAISEVLVRDPKFGAWVGFQLFETRVASAHLADSLKKGPNEYWIGEPAFDYAWGKPMYDWHREHPAKGTRFKLAMEGVAETLDPGNSLLQDWFTSNTKTENNHLVIEVGASGKPVSLFLAEEFPNLLFRVQLQEGMQAMSEESREAQLAKSQQLLSPQLQGHIQFQHHGIFEPQQAPAADRSKTALVYIIRNILWNLSDEESVKLLQTLIPVMAEKNGREVVLLINDLLSPAPGTFAPHVEKAYRRRDFTLTTMHNVKQRTEKEWRALFGRASSRFKVTLTTGYTSHSCKGLWELRWRREDEDSAVVTGANLMV